MVPEPADSGWRPAQIPEHGNGRPSLGEEARARARERLIEGAASALAAKGLAVTADEVAEASGVSRRTVFRHFATHGDLLVAGLTEVFRNYDAGMPDLPSPGADVKTWLWESAVAIHELNKKVIGRAFWDFYVDRPGTPPEVTATMADLTARRAHYAHERATAAWSLLGGDGDPAQWVIDSFVLQLSSFATNALVAYDTAEAGRVSAQIIWAVLSTALAEQRGRSPGAGTDASF